MHKPPSHIKALDLLRNDSLLLNVERRENNRDTTRNDALSQTTRVRGLKSENINVIAKGRLIVPI